MYPARAKRSQTPLTNAFRPNASIMTTTPMPGTPLGFAR